MTDTKQYLGDGAYYEFDGYGVELTTSNGIDTTNTIYLEADVIAALVRLLSQDFNRELLAAIVRGEP